MIRRLGVQAAVVDGKLLSGDVAIVEDRIVAVGLRPGGRRGLAAPGFVDLQVNGFAGVDFNYADVEGFRTAAESLSSTGVTAFQPTLITLPEQAYAPALSNAAVAQQEIFAPRLLGVHLEGPFLSPERAGAHDPTLMLTPDLDLAKRLLRGGPVSHFTLAPELPGALELIDLLIDQGVTVAVGHSGADAATTHAAFDRGARAVTHLFNAQRPFSHRDPGITFASLAHPAVTVSLIVDRVHLADETTQVAFRAARGRVAVITDAVSSAGLEPGTYRIGTQTIYHDGKRVTLADGTLAGSALTMDTAVRNLVELGVSLPEAVEAASTVPARTARRPHLGSLIPGKAADAVVFDDNLQIRRTLVAGAETHAA